MIHFTIRKAGILAFKCGFVAFGLLAAWQVRQMRALAAAVACIRP